jgi:hypothetical protein
MKVRKLFVTVSMLIFLLTTVSWAQDPALTISDIKVEPSTVGPGSMVLISCQVNHSDGLMNIERVAATVSSGNLNSSYPMLYDDGTNGDMVAEDGICSLEISAGNAPGEATIVFIAVDTEHYEIESAPVILTIQ